ncbi:SGNH/GDSL hydrolase family protein [Ectobacillus sp. sgz5001026]|uniref:SGNH/GDSL hydrolase family protein n=1 Tax=Ectobacillus sp. sgz5001026 TaxID=3242473 RepID=UPI0036D292DC
MRSKIVKFLLAVTTAALVLFAFGFTIAVKDVLNPKASAITKQSAVTAETKKPDTLQIISLGDSLTRGVGDNEGLGYIGRLRSSLETDYKQKVALNNLAVSGARTPELLKQLSDNGVRYSISRANVIMITIGGNDVFPGWQTIGETDLTQFHPDVATFQENVKKIITEIREINPDSPIYWLGLYNPFEDVPELKGSGSVAIDWNNALIKSTIDSKGVYIVPTYDLFQGRTKDLLFSDHFHPNNKGYTLMANRLLQDVVSQFNIAAKGATNP